MGEEVEQKTGKGVSVSKGVLEDKLKEKKLVEISKTDKSTEKSTEKLTENFSEKAEDKHASTTDADGWVRPKFVKLEENNKEDMNKKDTKEKQAEDEHEYNPTPDAD